MNMKTNDIFDLRRFGKYFATDVRTCTANYGLSLMTISLLLPIAAYAISAAFNLIIRSTWDGPDIALRATVFAVALICLVVTMPVKCYGKITEKQYGSFWLTLPASRLEKFISMVILTCIIVPLSGIILYLGIDALICAIDHTCGGSIIAEAVKGLRGLAEMKQVTINLMTESLEINDAALAQDIVNQISSPWLYVDEIFGITLPLLLGAIYFKNGKTVRTFLALFVISAAMSSILSPIMLNWTKDIIDSLNGGNDAVILRTVFNSGVFRNLVIIDNTCDCIYNTGLLACIWFRIKTLKH